MLEIDKKNSIPIRVLFFTLFFEYKRSKTYYTEEILSLINAYSNIEFLVYSFGSKKNEVIRYHERILWVKRKGLKNLLFFRDMIKIFLKFKPSLIHSVYVVPSIIMGIFGRFFKIPSILHGRGTDINYFPFKNIKSRILLIIAGMLNKVILIVSEAMKNDCIQLNLPKKKLITIYDGVNFIEFNPEGKKYYNYNRAIEILHIGRFSHEKAHNLIIETCKMLRDNNIKFHLTLIGIGPLKKQIIELVRNYKLENLISLIGWVKHKNIPNYMLKSDLFILPSITEGLPISVIEAMSMKLPIIMTNVGGMPELANKDGCILIDKNNKESLYNAILYYYNNPNKVKIGGDVNREFITKNFNWNIHAKKLYKIYLRLKNKKL